MNDWYETQETVKPPRTVQSKMNATTAAILIFFGFTGSVTLYDFSYYNHFDGPLLDLVMDFSYLSIALMIMVLSVWVNPPALKISGVAYVVHNIVEVIFEFVFADKIINEIVIQTKKIDSKNNIKIHFYLSVFFHLLITLIPMILIYNLCKLAALRTRTEQSKETAV